MPHVLWVAVSTVSLLFAACRPSTPSDRTPPGRAASGVPSSEERTTSPQEVLDTVPPGRRVARRSEDRRTGSGAGTGNGPARACRADPPPHDPARDETRAGDYRAWSTVRRLDLRRYGSWPHAPRAPGGHSGLHPGEPSEYPPQHGLPCGRDRAEQVLREPDVRRLAPLPFCGAGAGCLHVPLRHRTGGNAYREWDVWRPYRGPCQAVA